MNELFGINEAKQRALIEDVENKEKIVEILNEEISHLLAASIQYMQHSGVYSGKVWHSLSDDILDHAKDDFKQATELSEFVGFYKGNPTTEINEIETSKENEEMMKQDMKKISSAFERYNKYVEIFDEMNEQTLKKYFEDLVVHEQEHLDFIQNFSENT